MFAVLQFMPVCPKAKKHNLTKSKPDILEQKCEGLQFYAGTNLITKSKTMQQTTKASRRAEKTSRTCTDLELKMRFAFEQSSSHIFFTVQLLLVEFTPKKNMPTRNLSLFIPCLPALAKISNLIW